MALRKSWLIGSPVDGEGAPTEATATAQDGRVVHAGLYARNTAGAMRAGVLGNVPGLVSDRSDMAVDIDEFYAVLTRGVADGVVPIANDALEAVELPAAPSSGSRWVRVYVLHHDDVDNADADNEPIFGVVAGAAAPTPTIPSLPAGALPLVRILQPANVLGSDNCTITEEYPMTSVVGGVVPVRDATEMNAWTPPDGGLVYRNDTDFFYERINGAWSKRSRSFTWGTIFAGNANSDGVITINHGLGVLPDWVQATLMNTANDLLDRISTPTNRDGSTSTQVFVRMRRDDTNAWFPNDFFRVHVTVGKN